MSYNVYQISKKTKENFSGDIRKAFDDLNVNSDDSFIVIEEDGSYRFYESSKIDVFVFIHELERAQQAAYNEALEDVDS